MFEKLKKQRTPLDPTQTEPQAGDDVVDTAKTDEIQNGGTETVELRLDRLEDRINDLIKRNCLLEEPKSL